LRSVALQLPGDSRVPELAREIAAAGGRLLLVGGWVRDALSETGTRRTGKDLDLEVFGLDESEVSRQVRPLGFTEPVGRHFPVWRHIREGIDLALPRAGRQEFIAGSTSALERAVSQAARHRDLTVNAMAWDPIDGTLFDPFDGQVDLAARRLRAVDAGTFATDPLRVLRAARLAGRLEAHFDPTLASLCRSLVLTSLPTERVAEEVRRSLTECDRPSRVFNCLAELDQLKVLPPIDALRGVPQDPRWHPEGDVFIHTNRVLDAAASIASVLPKDEAETLLWASLCHDLGKPETTEQQGDRISSQGHEAVGAQLTRDWLHTLHLSGHRINQVCALVAHHLAPAQLVAQEAGPRAYRRLARKLAEADVTLVELERVARADHLGRTTPEALEGRFDAGADFLREAEAAQVKEGVRSDVVQASLVMSRGVPAGPELGRVLRRCREIQDETGWQDPERILERAVEGG
jgi:tRNA nucleotidyltransferase (CCA-adding enzyme)